VKKFICFLLACLLFVGCSYTDLYAVYATNNDDVYYRVGNETTYLYKTSNLVDSTSGRWFLLPNTYFVKKISAIDDNVLYVEFDGIDGYVSTSNLIRVYENPATPYPLNITFDIVDIANAVMYTEPDTSSSCVGIIPYDATNIKSYGTCLGTAVVEANGNVWYYCTYQSAGQGKISGYIYNTVVCNAVAVSANTEELAIEPIIQVNGDGLLAPELQNTESILLIVGLGIPALVLLYLLFKPERHNKKIRQKLLSKSPKSITYIEKHNGKDELDF